MLYLNDQLKELYHISNEDFEEWCKKNKKSKSYKETIQEFVYKLRTNRLVKEDGRLVVKKPRHKE